MDELDRLLRPIIWVKRKAFLTQAVEEGVITQDQMDMLMLMHLARDEAHDRGEL